MNKNKENAYLITTEIVNLFLGQTNKTQFIHLGVMWVPKQ